VLNHDYTSGKPQVAEWVPNVATTIRRTWLRRAVIGVCTLIPVLVGYARRYGGMHHLSDVLVGAINGLVCAGLAYTLMSRSRQTTD